MLETGEDEVTGLVGERFEAVYGVNAAGEGSDASSREVKELGFCE
jgi:hypothetical protein